MLGYKIHWPKATRSQLLLTQFQAKVTGRNKDIITMYLEYKVRIDQPYTRNTLQS